MPPANSETVADYHGLPADVRDVLPTAAELEAVIDDEIQHRPDSDR
ncbi:hypothetical protein [Ruania alba]|nr:hypothetical protein [Ruania alba]